MAIFSGFLGVGLSAPAAVPGGCPTEKSLTSRLQVTPSARGGCPSKVCKGRQAGEPAGNGATKLHDGTKTAELTHTKHTRTRDLQIFAISRYPPG